MQLVKWSTGEARAFFEVFKGAHRRWAPWQYCPDEVGGRPCDMWHTGSLCNPLANHKWEVEAQVHGLRKGWRWRVRFQGRAWIVGWADTPEAAVKEAEAYMYDWGFRSYDDLYSRLHTNRDWLGTNAEKRMGREA
jgi:hypothetical protein